MTSKSWNPKFRVVLADRLAAAALWAAFLFVCGSFLWILGDLLVHGAGAVDWDFLTKSPRDAGRAGGILPILVSTLLVLAVCLAAVVPLGTLAAAHLAGPAGDGPAGRAVRRSLDVLAGVPSIVFGLFGNAFFCVALGMGFSILSGGLSLACMVLPLYLRTAEEGLRAVPAELRLAAEALSLSRATTLRCVLLPAAAPALAAGLVLAVGRALAETAVLLFTSGYVDRMPSSLLDSGRVLSLHVYDLAMNVPGGEENAYASALVLMVLLLAVNLAAGSLARRVPSWNARP